MGEVTEAKINRETGSNKSSASRELSLRTGNDVTLNLFSACDSCLLFEVEDCTENVHF